MKKLVSYLRSFLPTKASSADSLPQLVIPTTVLEKIEARLYSRPQYAYGLWRAACEAKHLGFSGITAIEFGVAGGNGLLTLEAAAADVEKETGIEVSIYGLDSGHGMPNPVDYKDLPHIWQKASSKWIRKRSRKNCRDLNC